MATRRSIMWFAILLVYVFNTDAIPAKHFSCPEVCDCHLSRINWVADCTNKNLTFIPHKGLDLETYILNMNDNFLSELELFPPSIKIWTLQLSNNLLTDVKKTTFFGLHHMLTLDLSNNLISYVDPYAFNDSKGLITIDLHGNQLAPIEDEPFLYSKVLLNLNIAYCRITNISPQFFVNISNLHTLDLSGNSLEEIKPLIFNPLKNIKHLILNDCNLKYISIHAFSGLTDLSRLELAQNKFTSSVDWTLVLRHLSGLVYLDLRNAGVEKLSIDTFANNTWLRNLVLSGNKLVDLNVAITLGENLFHLDFLDLSNCDLKNPLSGNAFIYARKLRTLILSGNSLISTNLPAILSPLVKLVTLSLRDCGLNRLTKNTFRQLTHLKELDISKNPLVSNNGSLRFLSILESLEHLDISYCNLEEISAAIFSQMSNLKSLTLTGNKLRFIEQGLFVNLKGLQVLELNNCGLRSLNNILFFNNFPHYPNLVELRMSNNPIDISENESIFPVPMTNLNYLDLNECNLSYIPEHFFITTSNLKRLSLKGNKLKGDERSLRFIKHLTNIEELNFSFNKMVSIEPIDFYYANRLVSLKLIGNPWICDCFIVDMWNWTLSTKGHIDVLDGSTRLYSYVNDQKFNYLVCDYDQTITPPMKPMTRPNIYGANLRFTWQRYVRDAMCSPVSFTVSRLGRII